MRRKMSGILLGAETAAETAASPWGGSIGIIAIYAVFIFALWFFMFRPQKKEQKRMAEMLADLAVGDVVLTTSGFYGVIISIEDNDTVIVEFGSNKNCRIPMVKTAISKVEKAE